jgi:hypothetical protein
MYEKDMTVFALGQRYADGGHRGFVNWFLQIGLLPRQPVCNRCFSPCVYEEMDFKDAQDGYCLHCSACEDGRTRHSIRTDTLFANSQLSLYQWAQLMSFYEAEISVTEASRVLGFTPKTISGIYTKLDVTVIERLAREPILFEGPFGVEIDEGFSVSKPKGGRGLRRKWQRSGEWIFGITERETGRTFACVVPNRNKQTLQLIIRVS